MTMRDRAFFFKKITKKIRKRRKEVINLTKREYSQPSITMYAAMEETPLLAGTITLDPDKIEEIDWKDETVDGGSMDI